MGEVATRNGLEKAANITICRMVAGLAMPRYLWGVTDCVRVGSTSLAKV